MSDTKKTTLTSVTCRSFIPYLHTDHSQGLKIKLAVRDVSDGEEGVPFHFIRSAGPTASILPVMLSLDDRQPKMDFFLLFQPDDYSSASSELKPFTNPEVEQIWEDALSCSGKGIKPADQGFPMSARDETRGWIPFAPILYCSLKDQYCAALCPLCGNELALCRDDQALAEAGLQPFSKSAERYLHCPGCHSESASPVFYARLPAVSPEAPVHDCRRLVSDYERLLGRADMAATLPCIGCEHRGDCFGSTNLVISRMVPLVFFPFHALLQSAPTLNLLDFIPLLGGFQGRLPNLSAATENSSGRQTCREQFQKNYGKESGFLFQGDGRHFLEVLYLKLTLLHSLFETAIRAPELFRMAVDRMSLEGFWVHLDKRSGRLPYLWGFDLQLVDIVGWPQQDDSNSEIVRSHARYFMANAWFYVLLNNARQDFRQIRTALSARSSGQELIVSDDPSDPFGPGNIFWDGSPCTTDFQYDSLWQESLNLGLSLLRAGQDADPSWSEQKFDALLTGLRDSVRRTLFQVPAGVDARGPQDTDDQRIAVIVGEILQEWMPADAEAPSGQGPEPGTEAESAAPLSEGRDIEETIILKTDGSLPGSGGLPSQREADIQTETNRIPFPLPVDDTERTMVISPLTVPSDEFDPDRTVIIGGSPPPAPGREETRASRASVPPREEDPDRTVVISPAPSAPVRDADADQTVVGRPVPLEPSEDQEKTVVISPAESTPASGRDSEQTLVNRMPVPPPEEDADLTMVISAPQAPAGEPDMEETVLMGGPAPFSREDPDRTVIIERQSHKGAPAGGTFEEKSPAGKADTPETPPDNDLEATVIMDPGPKKK